MLDGQTKKALISIAGKAIDITWTITENKIKDDKSKGVYFIRTNYQKTEDGELWDIYNTHQKTIKSNIGGQADIRCYKL